LLASISFFRVFDVESSISVDQPNIASFLHGDHNLSKQYGKDHPQQQQRQKSFIENLIIGCALPLSLVDNEHFQAFCHDLDHKFQLPSRTYISQKVIPAMAKEKHSAVTVKLSTAKFVTITVDIWTDRRCHSYMGVTAHTFINCLSESMLLAFVTFSGSHTGQNIATKLDNILSEHCLKSKVAYVVTDNAANMLKAITVLNEMWSADDKDKSSDDDSDDVENDEDDNDEMHEHVTIVDEEGLWQGLAESDDSAVGHYMETLGSRLSCFAHTLQLVIKDGLAKISSSKGSNMKAVMGKCLKMSALCHQSALFRTAFEEAFGKGRAIPAANATRWNSTHTQLKAICNLDLAKLNDMLRTANHICLVVSQREMAMLQEFVHLLQPFAEATERTQGENYATVGCVVPTVIGLYKYLSSIQQTAKYHGITVRALLDSLSLRFGGLLTKVSILDEPANTGFNSLIYPMASLLDPTYGFIWLEDELPVADINKQLLLSQLQDAIIHLAEEVCSTGMCLFVVS
jgi:hypothetical protein